MREFQNILPFLTGIFLIACQKEELPVKPYDRGDAKTVTIEMGPHYDKQVWYDLDENKVVSTNDKWIWDIAFDCSDTGQNIYLNSSVAMMAARIHYLKLEDAKADADLFFLADHPHNPDSLALTNWWKTPSAVWLLDLGYTNDGKTRGQVFFQVVGHTDANYTISYRRPGSDEVKTAVIEKNNLYNRSYFSFATESQVEVEPMKTEYDICFTLYTEIFYKPDYLPYLVNGVLLNPYYTTAAVDSAHAFGAITPEDVSGHIFTSRRDVIGYDWKVYDFDLGEYVIHPEKNYIVRDHEGFYFKLHFTDFYNAEGEKGYPLMEVQRL